MRTASFIGRLLSVIARWRGTFGLCVGLALHQAAHWALVPFMPTWQIEQMPVPDRSACDALDETQVLHALSASQYEWPDLVFECHAADLLNSASAANVEARASHDQRAATASGMRAVLRSDLDTAVFRFLQTVSLAHDGPAGFQNLAAVYVAKGDYILARWMLDTAIQQPGASCSQILAESDLKQLTSTPGWPARCAYLQDSHRCRNGDAATCALFAARGLWFMLTSSDHTPAGHSI